MASHLLGHMTSSSISSFLGRPLRLPVMIGITDPWLLAAECFDLASMTLQLHPTPHYGPWACSPLPTRLSYICWHIPDGSGECCLLGLPCNTILDLLTSYQIQTAAFFPPQTFLYPPLSFYGTTQEGPLCLRISHFRLLRATLFHDFPILWCCHLCPKKEYQMN